MKRIGREPIGPAALTIRSSLFTLKRSLPMAVPSGVLRCTLTRAGRIICHQNLAECFVGCPFA